MGTVLLHIGFAKCGSTFLQQWFEKHPEIYFQPKRFAQSNKEMPQNYLFSCEDFSIWQGEPIIYGLAGSVHYDYRKFQENISAMLAGLFPAAKVLIVTRSHRQIIRSIYSQYIAKGGAFSLKEIFTVNPGMFQHFLNYNYVINLYRAKFGKENVIILPYEMLRDEPAKFIAAIESQLSISGKFDFPNKQVNESFDKRILNAYFKTSKFIYTALKPFPKRLQTWLYLQYMQQLRGNKPNEFIKLLATDNELIYEGLDDFVQDLKPTAEILRGEPVYQPYLNEYFD